MALLTVSLILTATYQSPLLFNFGTTEQRKAYRKVNFQKQ